MPVEICSEDVYMNINTVAYIFVAIWSILYILFVCF